MQEFPHALPFRQYLQHGSSVSFAFPFLDAVLGFSLGTRASEWLGALRTSLW